MKRISKDKLGVNGAVKFLQNNHHKATELKSPENNPILLRQWLHLNKIQV